MQVSVQVSALHDDDVSLPRLMQKTHDPAQPRTKKKMIRPHR